MHARSTQAAAAAAARAERDERRHGSANMDMDMDCFLRNRNRNRIIEKLIINTKLLADEEKNGWDLKTNELKFVFRKQI